MLSKAYGAVIPLRKLCSRAFLSLFKVPFDHIVCAPARLPRHMHLDLSQHVMRNVSRLRLRAHTLKVATAAWDTRNALLYDCCPCDEIQDEAHALSVCRDANVCALRRMQAYLVQAVYDFLLQHNNKLSSFISELMDIMLTGEDQ
eukprot:1153786-Pelagomonas_calceolata.AAC.1